MARFGKQPPFSFHVPLARRLITKSSRNGLFDTFDKLHKTDRRPVKKVDHGIVEKIQLVLLAACILLCTILQIR